MGRNAILNCYLQECSARDLEYKKTIFFSILIVASLVLV